jgi:tetratricopeptide (TPR) repeat protein
VDKYLVEGTPDGLPERRQPPSDPEIERLFREEALALVERKEWRAASGAFDRIIREDPEFTEAYFERARTLYHLGDHDACLRDCQETRRRDPSHTGALVFMGACYHLQGQTASVGYQRINYWRLAYDAFDRALAINPNLDVAHECTELYGRILWVVGASP